MKATPSVVACSQKHVLKFIFSILQLCFSNSSDDIEELHYTDERRKVPPITANSHLHCHASTLHIPNEAFYADPKTQKYVSNISNIYNYPVYLFEKNLLGHSCSS